MRSFVLRSARLAAAAAALVAGPSELAPPPVRAQTPADAVAPAKGAPTSPGGGVDDPDLWVPGNQALPAGLPREAWKAPEPVPVRFHGQILFYVRGGLGDLTPQVRAERIQERLGAIADTYTPQKPVRVEDGTFSDIFVGDDFVASISDLESGSGGISRLAHAQAVARKVAAALREYRAERSPKALLRSGIEAAIATVVLVVFLLGLRLLYRRAGPRVEALADRLFSRARIQRLDLITPEVKARLIAWSGRAFRVVLILVAVFAWLQVVLHRFPWTREGADRWLGFVLQAARSVLGRVVEFLPNLVYIALFALVGYLAGKVNRVFFAAVQRGAIRFPGFYPEWAHPTSRIVGLLIFALVGVAVFPYLPGSGSSAFQAIGIFLGAIISFGSGSSVANAIAGFVLTYMRPFEVGEFVKIGETVGTVREQTALVVRVLTIRNESVTIPAATVLASQIVNYSAQARTTGVAIRTGVTIGYDVPWRKVHELLLAAAGKTTNVQEVPKPWVIQTALSDFYVAYELDVYIDDPSTAHFILSELNQNVQDCFFEAGVEILSPHYAQLRDGNQTAIPDPWLPEGERTRSFKVSAVVRESSPGDPVPAGHRGGDEGLPGQAGK